MEVFSQRLQQEYSADPIITAPSVIYQIKLKATKQNIKQGKDIVTINNPALWPEPQHIEECFEPMVIGKLFLIW